MGQSDSVSKTESLYRKKGDLSCEKDNGTR